MALDEQELGDTLMEFRLSLIRQLGEISMEISVLQQAVQEAPVSAARLEAIRKKAKKVLGKFEDTHALHISLPHQRR